MHRVVYNTDTNEIIALLLPTESVAGPANIHVFAGTLEEFMELNPLYVNTMTELNDLNYE